MKTVVSTTNNTKTTALPAAVTILPNKVEPIVTESQQQMHFSMPDANMLVGNSKRPASLDLNKTTQAKKPRLVTPLLLDSPDMQNIKTLNTPDLEKILLSSNMMQTPQPGTVFPTKVGPVTSEQEAFGKGFEEALHSLHTSKNAQANSNSQQTVEFKQTVSNTIVNTVAPPAATTTTAVTGMSGGSFTYTNLDATFPVSIKDEPQNPASPPVDPEISPIDMETQEKIKLERKRQRNRVAASKCRKRKLERISKLEEKVKNLKTENGELGSVVKTLKDHVAQLKEQVMEHFNTGCNLPTIYSTSILMGAGK